MREFLNLLLFLIPIFKFKVEGKSMEPTLGEGSIVLVNRLHCFFTKPKVGEIVIIKSPKDKKHLIKRIKKIDNNKYFVVGDNLKESTDSRDFGWVSKKEIIGKVWF